MAGDAADSSGGAKPRPRQDNQALQPEAELQPDQPDQPGQTEPQPEPQPQASLQVRLNDDPALGFCVFALRRYRRGDVLFSERTALEATHDVYKTGDRNVYEVYSRLSPVRKRRLHGSFPYLAWANGVDAHAAAEARTLIDANLLSKDVVIDNRLTAADHMRMRPDFAALMAADGAGGASPARGRGPWPEGQGRDRRQDRDRGRTLSPASTATTASASADDQPHRAAGAATVSRTLAAAFSGLWGPAKKKAAAAAAMCGSAAGAGGGGGSAAAAWGEAASLDAAAAAAAEKKALARRETVDWFSRYAFRLKPEHAFPKTGNHYQAAVYLLTDLINHRCAGFQNCKVVPDIGRVKLVAERDIEPGEEVTINYSKDVKDFRCKGECCMRKQQPQQAAP